MNDDYKKTLLAKLREKSPHSRLPIDIAFKAGDKESTIEIHIKKPTANMQTDAAAFEGWSLVLKSALPDLKEVILKWSPPSETKNKHYQRFLYRVHYFAKSYDWLSIGCLEHMAAMRIKESKPNGFYKVNVPSQRRYKKPTPETLRKNDAKLSERELEVRFVENPASLRHESDVHQLGNQLPLGVFEQIVSGKDNRAIFTGKASALDLWGVNKKGNVLSIFELKKSGNSKVGAISELFFYAMAVRDIVEGFFAFKDCKPNKDVTPWPPHFINGEIKEIKAYLLTPDVHPLLDNQEGIYDLLNRNVAEHKVPISFGYIWFDTVDNCKRRIPA